MTVVISAIFNDRHSTLGKILSEKKRAKLSSVNCSVSTELPCLVNAYSTIRSIGARIMIAIHTRYGYSMRANDFIAAYTPILDMT